ncbi:hypothetical protein UFOVP326_74 [uncultured Caudovirales phage]|uniref:Uncharacterized protein n=1 Tax=uncultured Caudovirales phage TaxID=2100421 RepID=A0A6J5LUD8_9CAUD|nr:hypothetical protein UFOVP326_74 [uncultured Caudovirales phage]
MNAPAPPAPPPALFVREAEAHAVSAKLNEDVLLLVQGAVLKAGNTMTPELMGALLTALASVMGATIAAYTPSHLRQSAMDAAVQALVNATATGCAAVDAARAPPPA